jgi:hypothetical protein
MANHLQKSDIEKEIQSLLATQKPDDEFVARLSSQLNQQTFTKEKTMKKPLILRPAFLATTGVVLFLITSFLYFSPGAVYAAVRRLFGYMPGVGIVNENAPLRILKEPVSITRDGVTVSVNRAILTAQGTQIDVDITGVPASAYADQEHASSCPIPGEYVVLPDGTRLDSYATIPSDIDHATFLMPCIFNTVADAAPTDWKLPLEFIPVPPEATILPIIEQQTVETAGSSSTAGKSEKEPFTLAIDQFVKDNQAYILIGSFHSQENLDGWVQINGEIQVKDANGKDVNYTIPEDIQIAGDAVKQNPWAIKFDANEVAFPVTIRIPGNFYTQVDPNLSFSIDFDAGEKPQFGQVWDLNQNITLGKYSILLESIRASENGYTFKYKYLNNQAGNITMPRVQIEGFESIGGGGGGGPDGGETNLNYKTMPTGKLHIIFSDIYKATNDQTWQVQWQPEKTE